MGLDAVTSASLNEDTRSKQGSIQFMAEKSEKKGADIHRIFVKETYNSEYSMMVQRAEQEAEDGTKFALASKNKKAG